MKTERIDLYAYFNLERPNGAIGYLNTYVLGTYAFCPNRVRPAMIILPGGGYKYRSDRENEPIAVKFLEKGYNVFVLEYSIAPISYPTQLIEGLMAVAYVRENAKSLGVNPDMIGAIGFSAGGHLCGMLSTMFNEPVVKEKLGKKAKFCKLNASVLCYPVILSGEKTNRPTMENISGSDKTLEEYLSIDKRVTKDSVPAFIWHTTQDGSVPVESSLELASAYRKAGVPFELHLFEVGGHGLSLCSKETNLVNEPVKAWIDMMFTWLTIRGFDITD